MAFGQLRSEKIGQLKEQPKPKAEEAPNPIQTGNIGIVNLEQKKKPHNITINNYNQNEPKRTPNMKYSDKQRYRRYKTKTEPNLLSKIQINEEDDIINKIKEAFGLPPDSKNSNYTEIDPSPAPFYKGVDDLPVENIEDRRERIPDRAEARETYLMEEITDISMEDAEEFTYRNMRIDEEFDRRLHNEAAKILQYNMGKHLLRKSNKKLARDLADAMTVSQLDDTKDVTVSSIVRGNKVIGLEWFGDNSPKRQERYSLGLDRALPTPKKFEFKPNTRDATTSPRGAGRPQAAAYRVANPTRVSVGEMTNPTEY